MIPFLWSSISGKANLWWQKSKEKFSLGWRDMGTRRCYEYGFWGPEVKCSLLSYVWLLATSMGRSPHQASCPWDSLGKSTGVVSHCLLQEFFLTQGLNPGLLHCRQVLYHLSHQGIFYLLIISVSSWLQCWLHRCASLARIHKAVR